MSPTLSHIEFTSNCLQCSSSPFGPYLQIHIPQSFNVSKRQKWLKRWEKFSHKPKVSFTARPQEDQDKNQRIVENDDSATALLPSSLSSPISFSLYFFLCSNLLLACFAFSVFPWKLTKCGHPRLLYVFSVPNPLINWGASYRWSNSNVVGNWLSSLPTSQLWPRS